MKPLELEIQGLYSYREKERLDFRPFHRVRLFGIFGKTGDGKSSILDAMTFALYGRLDRLGRNLREAVNPASGHLLVNFSFELDGEVFRVNRLFDPRSGTKAVLYRQEGGRWLPLAERTREVEDQLERILGLRFEEFTKVVILPQGKFAEFLRLTPARRAEMLEKLFDLEMYGDALFQKVSRHLEALRATLEEKKGRLESLREVSSELLAEKGREKEALEEELRAGDEAQKALRRRLEQLKHLARLLEEVSALKARESALLAHREEMEEIRRRLAQDQRLSPLKPIFEEFRKLVEEVPRGKEELKALSRQEQEKAEALEGLKQALTEFLREKEARLRLLTEKEAEVRALAAALEDLRKREEGLRGLEKRKQELQKKLSQAKGLLRKKQEEAARIQEAVRQAEEEQKRLSLAAEEKDLLERLEALRPDFSLLREKEERHQRLHREYLETQKRREKTELALAELWAKALAAPFPRPEEAPQELERLLDEVEARLERVSAECRRYERLNQAVVLAAELRPGEPCPVCGSREHPHPLDAAETREAYQELVAEEERLKREKKRLRQAASRLKPLFLEWERLEADLKRREGELHELKKEMEDLAARLRKELPEVPLAEFSERYQALRDRQRRAVALLEELERRRREMQSLSDEIRALEQEVTRLQGEIGELSVRLEEEREALLRERREILARLKDRLPEEVLREIGAERKELEDKEHKWREQERALSEELSRIQKQMAALKGLLQEKEGRLARFGESLSEAVRQEGLSSVEELGALFLDEDARKGLEQKLRDWEEALSSVKKRREQVEEELRSLPERELPPEEPKASEEALAELEEALAALREKKGRLETEMQQLARDLREKEKLLAETRELEQELLLTDELRQHLRGRALVTFAARHLFGEILDVANDLLRDLLGERFLIRMSRENFSFSVYDLRLGHERPVETLSGGETFVVSFVLALALSAYIQRLRARPIHFFFIDEGFGSLDEDLLEAVSQVLEELRTQDRLVGIITHLERFKQLLPAHVLVKKDSTGTSRLQVRAPALV